VATRREAHHADAVRVDLPAVRLLAYQAHCLLPVRQNEWAQCSHFAFHDAAVVIGLPLLTAIVIARLDQAILQDECGYTTSAEPLREVCSLVLVGKTMPRAAGTQDDAGAICRARLRHVGG